MLAQLGAGQKEQPESDHNSVLPQVPEQKELC
jgi:hypothetical protein